MPYTAALALLNDFGDSEMAQLSAPESPAVDGALLRLTVEAGDRSGYTVEDQAAADRALERIDTKIADAANEMDSYISSRYILPLPVDMVDGSPLSNCNRDIARYRLMDNAMTEDVREVYLRWIGWLKDVARGLATLGHEDTTATGLGRVSTRQGESAFDWSTY